MSAKLYVFLAFCLITFQGAYGIKPTDAPYVRNPYVDDVTWNALTPYFLPSNSHERAVLDRIFMKKRALSSFESMEKMGFWVIADVQKQLVVAFHQKLKGYIIKAYLDTFNVDEAYWFKRRIDGARHIQASIEAHGFEHIMKVPKKWIYPLPPGPDPKPGNTRRNFLLICEEMDILSDEKNRNAYQKKASREILDALYLIITENLLIDSVYIDNIPFCKDGRIAFIDTEHFLDTTHTLSLEVFLRFISPQMGEYWQYLMWHGPSEG